MKRLVQSRKLLVASIGVATVLYACEKKDPYPPGNLMAPEPSYDAGAPPTSGNLVAPPPMEDAAPPIAPAADASPIEMAPPGNLMPPPPPDAGHVLKKPPHHPPGNLMPPPPHPKPSK